MRYHIWVMEKLMQRCGEETKKMGKMIDTMATVIDMKGLSMAHRAGIPVFKLMSRVDERYYPVSTFDHSFSNNQARQRHFTIGEHVEKDEPNLVSSLLHCFAVSE